MATAASRPPPGQQASLGALLAEAVSGVVQAQRRLDHDALARVTQYVATPQGELALPPLWYTFSEVAMQLELAAMVTRAPPRGADERGVRLECRLVNPTTVSLFGYSAASGFKVSLRLAPREAAPAPPPESADTDVPDPPASPA